MNYQLPGVYRENVFARPDAELPTGVPAFIGRVARDFHRIYGHARPGASQALNQSFGARLGPTRKNWHDTGEDFRLYVLHLHNSASV